MKAEEFDRLFDEGDELSDNIDWASARRPNLERERVAVELPRWVVNGLDHQARTHGVSREALLELWIAERLQLASTRPLAAE